MRLTSFSVASLQLLVTVSGCVITESGNPPVRDREIDVDRVDSMDIVVDAISITGDGAVMPAGGRVLLANLNRPGFALAAVDDEGSFEISVPAEPTDVVRLQAFDSSGDSRRVSNPFDFRGVPTRAARLDPQLGECLGLVFVRDQVEGEIQGTNRCGRPLELALRRSGADGIFDAANLNVGEGQPFAVPISFTELDVVTFEESRSLLLAAITINLP